MKILLNENLPALDEWGKDKWLIEASGSDIVLEIDEECTCGSDSLLTQLETGDCDLGISSKEDTSLKQNKYIVKKIFS